MQEKTIKSYNDEKNRIQLLQIDDDQRHFFQVRVNRRISGMWYNLDKANRAFQSLVYNQCMQTNIFK